MTSSENYSNFFPEQDGEMTTEIWKQQTNSKPMVRTLRSGLDDFNRILFISSETSPLRQVERKKTASGLIAEESLPLLLPDPSMTGCINDVTPIKEQKQETLELTNLEHLRNIEGGGDAEQTISVGQIEKNTSTEQ